MVWNVCGILNLFSETYLSWKVFELTLHFYNIEPVIGGSALYISEVNPGYVSFLQRENTWLLFVCIKNYTLS